jgi:hypothetical protein
MLTRKKGAVKSKEVYKNNDYTKRKSMEAQG